MKKERLTTVQYKQKIIHLQSEVTKYQKKIKDYEDNYHYQLLKDLKEKNQELLVNIQSLEGNYQSLLKEKQGLSTQLKKLHDELTEEKKENSSLKEEITKLIKEREELRSIEAKNINDQLSD